MRTSDAAMITAQKAAHAVPRVSIALTKSGASDATYKAGYGTATENRIIEIAHVEEEFSQRASVVLHNRDKVLTTDLSGYKAFLTWGMVDASGADNVTGAKCAPLWVVDKQDHSSQGELLSTLTLWGIPDLLAFNFAQDYYWQDSSSDWKVKRLIQAVVGGILPPAFDGWAQAYSTTFDSEDQLMDSFVPAELFEVNLRDNALSKLRELLGWTKSVTRGENDTNMHFLVPIHSHDTWEADTKYELNDYVQPTTPNNNFTYKATAVAGDQKSGASEPTFPTTAGNTVVDDQVTWTAVAPEYEYSLASGEHTFFSKVNKKRVVMPNYVTIRTDPNADGTQYIGVAEDTDFSNLLHKRYMDYAVITSQEQADYLAKAVLQNFKRFSSPGGGVVPMHPAQEVHDWVKITDDRQDDTRLGSVGQIRRRWKAGSWKMEIGFGASQVNPYWTYALLAPPASLLAPLSPRVRAQVEAEEELFRGIR